MLNRLTGFALAFFFLVSGFSQDDSLYPLSSNPALSSSQKDRSHSSFKLSTAALTLPFFDDFAYEGEFPHPAKWLDSSVFVNRTYPRAPFTVGVVSFDGLNKFGYPYNPLAPVTSSAGADTLTSLPIDISMHSPGDSLFISFFYQPRGWGDAPETNDSLVLEFLRSTDTTWIHAWSKAGYNPGPNDSTWKYVLLPLTDASLFQSNFQFRFRNRATLAGALDHWHIDYVYLKAFRSVTDTVFKDNAFGYQSPSILRTFSSMPWWQFASGTDIASTHPVFIRNNDYQSSFSNYSVAFEIYNETGTVVHSSTPGAVNVPNFLNGGWDSAAVHNNPSISIAPFVPTGPIVYSSKHWVFPNDFNADENFNDTLKGYHHFFNFYSYDDGTAEAGYGLNTFGAMMAVQIKLNTADTIRALDIYFDPVINVASIPNLSYTLKVWGDNGGIPGNVVYSDTITRNPSYYTNQTINTFVRDTFALPVALGAGGTYYVGIQQTSNQPLNVGFDRNFDHRDKMFYNTSGNWANATFPGSYMMRPVMRSLDFFSGVPQLVKNPGYTLVFPNPAKNQVTIFHSGIRQGELVTAELYDLAGRLVLQDQIMNNQSLDLGAVNEGIYILRLSDKRNLLHTTKLFIAH